MSLISTSIFNPVWWNICQWDYLTGNVVNGNMILPGNFNKHTVWIAQFQFPTGLFATSLLKLQIQGVKIDFQSTTTNTDYPLYLFRPPASSNAGGTVVAAGLAGPGLMTGNNLTASYKYGIGGGASAIVPIIGEFGNDETCATPLSNINSAAAMVTHSVRDGMVHVSSGGSNTSPNSIVVTNMGICSPQRVEFDANQIQISCPNVFANITPTSGQPYWAYGFCLIKSEQV